LEESTIGPVAQALALLRAGGTKRREGVTLLYAEFASRLRRFYAGRGATPAEAADFTQDCFVRVMRAIDSFQGEAPQFVAWIWTTARNVLIDARRKDRSTVSLDDDGDEDAVPLQLADPTADPAGDVEADSVRDCVRRGFKAFAAQHPQRAQCLAWLAVDRFDIGGIAELIGRSAGATREYLSQSRKKLKPFLEPCFAAG
jgi:RNA polymerase sigma factor (sigma-70 family)